jgi:hypothetical protein
VKLLRGVVVELEAYPEGQVVMEVEVLMMAWLGSEVEERWVLLQVVEVELNCCWILLMLLGELGVVRWELMSFGICWALEED